MYLKRIADLRIDNDLKQKEIAKFLGVDRSTYSKWESGDNKMSLEQLDKLTMKYKVSFDYIFEYSKTKRIDNCIYSPMNKEMLRHNIRLMRKRMGLTQEELASKLGISKSTYNRYERGTLDIPIDKFSKFFIIFDISLDVLAGKVKLSKKENEFIEV